MIDHPTVVPSNHNDGIDNENDNVTQGNESDTQQKVKLYLPTAIPSDIRSVVLERLAEVFGGFTINQSRGGWVDDDGQLVTETVEVVESIAPNDCELNPTEVVKSTANWVALQTDEDVVMWEVDETQSGMEDGA